MQATTTNFSAVENLQRKEFLILKAFKAQKLTQAEYLRKRESVQRQIDKAVRI